MKQCRKCSVELVEGENWYPSQARRNSRICKQCQKEYVRQWQADNPERYRTLLRRWQADNPGRQPVSSIRRRQKERWAKTERGMKYVYLLHAPEVDRYKIGQSSNPERRIHELSKGPVEVFLVWAGDCEPGTESMLKARFRDQRVRGEWFQSLTDEQIQYVMDL